MDQPALTVGTYLGVVNYLQGNSKKKVCGAQRRWYLGTYQSEFSSLSLVFFETGKIQSVDRNRAHLDDFVRARMLQSPTLQPTGK
jgi:hypothetical protein